jgi:acyl carrier protein
MWSLGRVARVEERELWGGMAFVHVDAFDSEHASVLAGALLAGTEDQLRIERGGILRVPRLVRAAPPGGAGHLDREYSYLVTGGLGHVGLHVAQWLAAQGVRHIVLTGRQLSDAADARDPQHRAQRVLDGLRARGISVRYLAVDVCDGDAMRQLFRTASPRIAGIFHAAGTHAVAALRDIEASQLDVALRAKVLGAWTLHELASEFPVDHFVMFSSMTSVVGGREQGGYAAANGFLDGLAAYRRRLGLPGLSIAWGPWGGGAGMAAPDAPLFAKIGVSELEPDRALQALRELLTADEACWAVADVDWQPFRGIYETHRRQPMFAALGEDTGARSSGDAGAAAAAFLDELAALSEPDRATRLHSRVKAELRQVLGADHVDDELERDFSQLQLDSLGAVQLRSRIERLLGVTLSSTVIFDHPSLGRLVAHLLEEANASLKHPEAAQ